MDAFSASRLVCPVIARMESASTPICSTTFASLSACSSLPRISSSIVWIFRRFSTVVSFVCAARLWISSASVAPSCARTAISFAAPSICWVMLLICSADAAVSSVLAASCSVVADTSSISPFRFDILVSIDSTTASIFAASVFTWESNPHTDSRIVSSVPASCPKSSFRFIIFVCILRAKLPPAITSISATTFFNDFVISCAIIKTSTATTASITIHTAIRAIAFCMA